MIEVNFECGTIEEIKRRAYEKGVNDAFDAAHKIESSPRNGGCRIEEIYRLFPDHGSDGCLLDRIMAAYSPMAIVSIIQDYEYNKNKLRVGDVVHTCDKKGKGITTNVNNILNKTYILWDDGTCGEWAAHTMIERKTGENMTIPEFLEKYGRIGE